MKAARPGDQPVDYRQKHACQPEWANQLSIGINPLPGNGARQKRKSRAIIPSARGSLLYDGRELTALPSLFYRVYKNSGQ